MKKGDIIKRKYPFCLETIDAVNDRLTGYSHESHDYWHKGVRRETEDDGSGYRQSVIEWCNAEGLAVFEVLELLDLEQVSGKPLKQRVVYKVHFVDPDGKKLGGEVGMMTTDRFKRRLADETAWWTEYTVD